MIEIKIKKYLIYVMKVTCFAEGKTFSCININFNII